MTSLSIKITLNGPYIVTGSIPLLQQCIIQTKNCREYRTTKTFPIQESYALCRCGKTKTPPFCDGHHKKVNFDGTETASHELFEERADIVPGPGVTLFDDGRCAYARFCHRNNSEVWTLTDYSDDTHTKQEAIKASSDCPAGRLVHVDSQDATVYEPLLSPAISLLEDTEMGVSGPLFVQGAIPLVGSDGEHYELRNRYTLCRCGGSQDMPFCDAMHINLAYHDGLALEK